MNAVSWCHYLLTLIIWCNELLCFIILNLLFTDSLHFPYVFTHGFIKLFFNVMNQIKIINQVLLGLLYNILRLFMLMIRRVCCWQDIYWYYELLMLNSFKRKRKMEEKIKSFRNRDIQVLYLHSNLLFNSTSNMDLFIFDTT